MMLRLAIIFVALSIIVGINSTTNTLSAVATPQATAAELLGVWGSERLLGPSVRGELTIERAGSKWTARLAGFEVPVRVAQDTVAFELPGEQGELRARLSADASRIVGHWIQPALTGGNQRYATPVELRAIQKTSFNIPVSEVRHHKLSA